MLRRLAAAAAIAAWCMSGAYAQDGKPANPQQERMAACSKEARDRKLEGESRRKHMSGCLKARKALQQDRIAACDKDARARDVKGDARRKFISACVKG